MHHFKYVKVNDNDVLHGEDVNLEALARQVGTPLYCYSKATLTRHFRVFDEAFSEVPHIVCFSVKANSNLAILNLFAERGSGFDIVSGGELERVIKAGGDPQKVVFAGVAKSRAEMIQALQAGILMFNVESEDELTALNTVAGEMQMKARVALRVNPDIDPKTHPYISTGLRKAKFGIDIAYAKKLFEKATDLQHVDVIGVDCHIGSQLTDINPFIDTLKSMGELIQDLRKMGLNIQYLDIGGGLGITYNAEKPPHPRDYAAAVVPVVKDLGVTLIMEPGRVIVGNAGVLLTECVFTKKSNSKNFVIIDAGMNDLIRPTLYQAHQEIQPVIAQRKAKTIKADVVGPICETGDFLALDRDVPDFERGELMAVMGAGAYGFSMASTYNSRPRVAEVLVDGHAFYVIRAREDVRTLLRGERVPLDESTRPRAFHLPFAKMHGAGNDFIVIDARNLMHEHLPWDKISKEICDRRFAIGADQVLLVQPPPAGSDAVCTMGIYDADGSQVEMCGNGLRAMALYLWEQKISRKTFMKIALPDRTAIVERIDAARFRVDMDAPILDGRKIPVAHDGEILNYPLMINGKSYPITCVSMGNPHAVIFLDPAAEKVKSYPVTTIGPKIETDKFFPKRVNVEFVNVISRSEINARVWERGSGETLACGSGACAIAVAGVLTKKTDRRVNIHLSGGTLELEWRESDGHVMMTGPAARVFDGDIDLNDLSFWRDVNSKKKKE